MSNIVALRRRAPVLVLGALIALTPAVAMARGSHGHSGHGHFSHSKDKDKKANVNSNGQDSTDRDKGQARAEDRKNEHALDNKAGTTDTNDTTTSGGG